MDGNISMAAERRYWLALSCIQGIGTHTAGHLVRLFGSPSALFAQSTSQLREAGISPPLIKSLQQPDWRAVDAACDWLEAAPDRQALCLTDAGYPHYLRQIPDPPPVLFAEGRVEILGRPQIGLVGSRNPTSPGLEMAADFAAQLTRSGMVVTSGLALGIDAAAHQGALGAGGCTVAVSGCGPDRVYPKSHVRLAENIRTNGVLVSEFFPGTPPLAANFPRRNRLISGLSIGVMVVEAALRSGSLITARCAAEQGREVFAVPGSIHNPLSRGCHKLIREGAKLVESHEDILEELCLQLDTQSADDSPAAVSNESITVADMSAETLELLDVMGDAPVSIDQLVERCGLTADAVSSILLLLELRGLVASQPGGTYSRLQRDNT